MAILHLKLPTSPSPILLLVPPYGNRIQGSNSRWDVPRSDSDRQIYTGPLGNVRVTLCNPPGLSQARATMRHRARYETGGVAETTKLSKLPSETCNSGAGSKSVTEGRKEKITSQDQPQGLQSRQEGQLVLGALGAFQELTIGAFTMGPG
jgi:hypothetical protein